MARRNRNVDRAIRRRQRGIRRATAFILAIGAVLVLWAWRDPQRQRERRLGQLELGDDTSRIAEVLGRRGLVCPTDGLANLRGRFASDVPPATVETVLERIAERTRSRRMIPIGDRPEVCAPRAGTTEIGVDAAGRIVWMVPVTGRSPLVYPNAFAPADSAADG